MFCALLMSVYFTIKQYKTLFARGWGLERAFGERGYYMRVDGASKFLFSVLIKIVMFVLIIQHFVSQYP